MSTLIRARLLLAGYTQERLADELGVTQSAVSRVLNGQSKSQRIERRIAELTRIQTRRAVVAADRRAA
ncbi:MAG: helix-turn-helix domain-containing protein [Betaproteobacteria bacterium]|nr:helix-turn-helix domain-containing protein [Betaproteobacteria bacterium]